MHLQFSTTKKIAGVAVFLIGLFAAFGAAAQSYSTQPQLRVEPGAHLGMIGTLATDAANRYIVSGSSDKTVRLWDGATGELLKVMRPPIGPGARGSVSRVSLSPDGATVAVGGNHCAWHQKTYCVLLFETASGRMVRMIGGFPGAVNRLAWSPDGLLLAMGVNQGGGLRILRTAGWSVFASDRAYRANIEDLHFSGQGKLATASADGLVRVYSVDEKGVGDTALKLLVRKPVSQLTRPSGFPRAVRFSPDGRRLAIAQARGAAVVSVHDPDTLDLQYRASTNWGRGLGATHLAWSTDGEMLYAGVGSILPAQIIIRRWPNGGRGIPTDLSLGHDVGVGDLISLKDGGVAWSGSTAGIGVFNKSGDLTWAVRLKAADFLNTADFLRVSGDGSKVEFSPDGGRSRLNFDLHQRKLSAGPGNDPTLRSPVVATANLNFYNQWRNARGALQHPTAKLDLGGLEITRSLSIAPDLGQFAVGTSSRVVNFDASGKLLWSVASFAHYAVNHSGDGRLIVAAAGDGSIRWYQTSNGRLLATLFASPDGKRWVLASPTGYYDASVGAEELIGWHINRRPDQEADFFPVSRLRSHFYRPEIVADIIATVDDSKAIALAAAAMGGGGGQIPRVNPTPSPPKPVPPVVATPVKPEPPKPVAVAPVVPTPPKAAVIVEPARPEPPKPVLIAPVTPPPPKPPVVAEPVRPEPPQPVVVAPVIPVPPKPAVAADPVKPEPVKPLPPQSIAVAPVIAPPPQPPVVVQPDRSESVKPDAIAPEESASEQEDEIVEAAGATVAQTVVNLASLLPPIVTILSPAPGVVVKSAAVTLKYVVRSAPDAPVTQVRARVNGLISAGSVGTVGADEEKEFVVTVPAGESEIMLFAENRNGTSSAASVKVRFGAPAQVAMDTSPMLYVLAIGVSDYVDPKIRLNYAAKDARDFVASVARQKGRFYRDVVVRELTDRNATNANVIDGFAWLQKNVTDKDVGMVFIAGHGVSDNRGRYYFLPANVEVNQLEKTSVPFSEIRTRLGNLQGKGLLFVDTCHAGDVMGGRGGFSSDVNGVLNELSSPEYGLVVLASSTGKQVSLEDSSWDNGAFTKALVEGLNGQADLKQRGRITHKMLDFYVSDRVDELTKGQQTPVNPSPMGVPDYVVAVTTP